MIPTRRDVLKLGGVSLTGGAIAQLSGCSELGGPPVQSRSRRYHDWLVEPGTVTDTEHYQFYRLEPAPIEGVEDELASESFERFEAFASALEFLGVDFDEMDELVVGNAYRVIAGDYDPEDVIDELEDDGFDDETTHEEYEIYLDETTDDVAVGVSDHHLVVGERTDDEDADEVVEAVVDVAAGEDDRYVDENEALGDLVEVLPEGQYVTGATHEEPDETAEARGTFEDSVGWGVGLVVEEGRTEATWAVAFDDDRHVDLDVIGEWVDETFDGFDDVELGEQGRVAVVEAAISTDEVLPYTSLPGRDLPTYLTWVPTPETLGTDQLHVQYHDFDVARDEIADISEMSRENVDFETYPDLASPYDFAEPEAEREFLQIVDPETSDVLVEVVTGSFDGETIRRSLDSMGLDRTDRGRYSIHRGERYAIGVNDGAIVLSSDDQRRTDEVARRVESVIAARTGEAPRYHESNPELQAIPEALERSMNLRIIPVTPGGADGALEGTTFFGRSLVELSGTPSSPQPRARILFLFADESDIDMSAIEALFESEDIDGEFRREGRAVILDGTDLNVGYGIARIGFLVCEFMRPAAGVRYGVC